MQGKMCVVLQGLPISQKIKKGKGPGVIWIRFLDRVGNGYRLNVKGQLNGWVRNRMQDITGISVIPDKNETGEKW